MAPRSGFWALQEHEEGHEGSEDEAEPKGLSAHHVANSSLQLWTEEEEIVFEEDVDDGILGDTNKSSDQLSSRLAGSELVLFRQERGLSLSGLANEELRDASETPPVVRFADLRRFGVASDLISSCIRCAGGSPFATAVQAECWGQLLRLREGQGLPPPLSASTMRDNAEQAAAALKLAVATAVPDDPDEELDEAAPVRPSFTSRCEIAEGRDIVGIAPTGSGKTMAYILPLLADGLCKERCPVPATMDSLFQRFSDLFPRSFDASENNDKVLVRLRRLYSEEKYDELRQAMKVVAKKAENGSKDEAVMEDWSLLHDGLETEGRLRPTGLVLTPTRELALQVSQVAKDLGGAVRVVLGGVDHERQREQLKADRPSLIVATPGRLRALCGQRPSSTTARLVAAAPTGTALKEENLPPLPEALVSLSAVQRLVLDEGDRLIEEGFEEDINALTSACCRRRLTLLFSATWTPQTELLSIILRPGALKVSVAGIPKLITQEVELVPKASRVRRLRDLLREFGATAKVLIFVLFKREAKALAKMLQAEGFQAWALEGNMSQAARTFTMQAFRDAKPGEMLEISPDPAVLVATDVAARGLDVPDVTHVVNFSLGMSIDSYVHRIGRCGRAGREGTAVTFVTDGDERLAGPLLKLLQEAHQSIPPGLSDMAKEFTGAGGTSKVAVKHSQAAGEVKLVKSGKAFDKMSAKSRSRRKG